MQHNINHNTACFNIIVYTDITLCTTHTEQTSTNFFFHFFFFCFLNSKKTAPMVPNLRVAMHSTPPFPIIPDMPHGVAYAAAAYKSLPIAKHNSPRVPTLLLCTRPHRCCGNKEATSVRRRSPSHMWAVSWKGRKKELMPQRNNTVWQTTKDSTHTRNPGFSHTHTTHKASTTLKMSIFRLGQRHCYTHGPQYTHSHSTT